MMKLEQRAPVACELSIRDVFNVARCFRRQYSDRLPDWAVGGGGAVKFLIEALSVIGSKTRNPPIDDTRSHKDLDIVVFDPAGSSKYLEHPLEIYHTYNWGPLVRCKYRLHEIPKWEFFVEMMTDYYNGFTPPHREETTFVTTRERECLWTLSPEYIIVSRLFHTRVIRSGIDDSDAKLLQDRFDLELEKIMVVVRRSNLAFLSEDCVMQAVFGKNYHDLEVAIEREAGERFGSVSDEFSQSFLSRGLLAFSPSFFEQQMVREKFELARRIMNELADFSLSDSNLAFWTVFFAIYHLDEVKWSVQMRKALEGLLGPFQYVPESGLALAMDFCQGLGELREELKLRNLGSIFPTMVPIMFRHFCGNMFRVVLLSELSTLRERMRNLEGREAVEGHLRMLMNLTGARNWRKEEPNE